MRLYEYPYVVVRIACRKCSRQGRYRLARLAELYGAEITLPYLRHELAGDCTRLREMKIHDICSAYFCDLTEMGSHNVPRPKVQLRVVK